MAKISMKSKSSVSKNLLTVKENFHTAEKNKYKKRLKKYKIAFIISILANIGTILYIFNNLH